MNYKLSVIIPVYNAQDTIQRCIDSVINQTIGFSNIELILYDDNSTDNTRKILKEYSEKYGNIILILSNKNSGYPGKGRNEGIKRATADYIMFMDNDDEYKGDICETLYNEIINENADIVSSNYLQIDDISSNVCFNQYHKGVHENNKIIFLNDSVFDFKDTLIWDKIYKKSIIINNNVQFPENNLGEDIFFNYSLLLFSSKIIYLKDYTGYIRYIHSENFSRSQNYTTIKSIIDILFRTLSRYKESLSLN